METLAFAARAHPVALLAYLSVMGFIAFRLVGMLRTTWRIARTPKDRRATVALAAVLGLAFCGLGGFLFMSVFA